jgi:methyl-accepting chemotaxis protein
MVVVMSGLIITTLLIVNLFTKAELDKTLQKDLKKTQTLFENYQALRTKEISVENKLIGEVPFLKALLSTRDRETILGFAKSFQAQIGSDLFLITDGEGGILASTDQSRSQGNLTGEHSIKIALGGTETHGVFVTRNALYQVTSAPVAVGDSTLGTITIGYKIDDSLAEEIKKMTDSEISFIVDGSLVATTLSGDNRKNINDQLKTIKDEIRSVSSQQKPSEHFDVAMGSENYISVLVPLTAEGKMEGAYLIQRNREEVAGFLGTIMNYIFLVSLGILLVGSYVSYLLAKQISDPIISIVRGSKAMADGDLSTIVTVKQRDEIGVLAKAFNEMSGRLRNLISQVRENTLAVTDVSQKLHQTSDGISSEVNKQESAVEETSSSIIQMGASITEVNKNVELLSLSANDTSSSILEMDATINEIANHMDNLSSAIEVTSSSISEMTSSVKEIALSIETLHSATDNTASSLHELNASVQQVEINAQRSNELSENTTSEAQKGKKSITETITGMQEIKSSFMEVQEIVSRLAQKSDSIGKIVKVIDEVAGQTNLLSLNAAIIAAQAGEHGKGFAVVAEEVKSLAERTASSTREIAVLIKDVQDETLNAVNAMVHGSERVQKGVSLSNESGTVLGAIIESSHLSTEMVKEIVKATKEQSRGIQEVDKAMVQIKEMVQQINRATHEQESASVEITKAVENMRVLGHEVKRSTQEQSKGSKLITTAVEKVTEMINHILEATQEQSQGSERINHALEIFKETAEENVHRVAEMNNFVGTLTSRSQQLEQEIKKFKL